MAWLAFKSRGSWLAVTVAVLAIPLFLRSQAPAAAQGGQVLRLALPPSLAASGVFDVLAPRFRFKTRITIEVSALSPADLAPALAAGRIDAVLACDTAELSALEGAAGLTAPASVFRARTAGPASGPCRLVGSEGAREAVDRLAAWLTDAAGIRALAKVADGEGPLFLPLGGDVGPTRTSLAPAASLAARGEELALSHCGRCHVIGPKNRYGGIGSTPSFPALRAIPGGDDRFAAFWTFAPHPAFTQVAGMTEPFPPERPSPIAPLELTLADVEAIVAFVRTIEPADLGAPIRAQ